MKLAEHENIQQLLEVDDKRVLRVKLADRLHNMRTIHGHPSPEKRKKIVQETQQFFIPIAQSLGMRAVEEEFKKIVFEVLNR